MARTKEKGIGYVWARLKGAYAVLAEHKYTTIAGTLVFFLIMSLVPFTFWLTLLFGRTFDAEEVLNLGLFGWARDLLSFLIHNAEGATAGVSVIFLATTLWSSTGFFYHLRRSGEIIYSYKRKKHGWKVRLSAAALTLFVLIFFAAAGALIAGVAFLARRLPLWLGYPAVYAVVLVTGFFAAWLLNAYICPYRCKPRDTVMGSLYTALAWLVASVIFSIYLNFSNGERLYGALSLVIVFLLWLYWMMICFTSGVIYNCRRMEVRGLEHKKL